MKKILVLFALIPFFVFSQSKIVTGTVNDENNLPLVGVNITVDNSNIGALTDFDGNYTISITFSYTHLRSHQNTQESERRSMQ